MDRTIFEQFNNDFWRLFKVNENLFPNRKAATLGEWRKRSSAARSAMIKELETNGAPRNRNPYFFVQDFPEPEPHFLSGREQDDYWKSDAWVYRSEFLVQVKYRDEFKICTQETWHKFNLEKDRYIFPPRD